MVKCKAVVQEGPRKGAECKFPPLEHGYCGRHQRNREYDEGIQEGKKWCRFFFRGCNITLSEDEIIAKEVTCKECKKGLCKKEYSCDHEGCAFKVKEKGFCKKHERDVYKKEEQEKGIKYCDIARGCFTICKEDMSSCEECLKKARAKDNERYEKRKQLTEVLQTTTHTNQRVCAYCGKDFEGFKTRYEKESVSCKDCHLNQAKQDNKRKDRIRNYKEENNKNLETYYGEYIRSAAKRGYEITLDFETFKTLVKDKCYYCEHKVDSETNGIDRVDNSKGYSKENCVTACWKCNRIKHFYDEKFFIEKCKIITKNKIADSEFYKTWKQYYYRSTYRVHSVYKKGAEKRNLEFDLSELQFKKLVKAPCYLCGYQSAKGIGIDRVDNTERKYAIDNCKPCCGSCNSMKGEFSLEEFIEQCAKIVEVWYKKNPSEEADQENTIVTQPERKNWKALGLYYAIMSDSADSFHDSVEEVYSQKEFDDLCSLVKMSTKEKAVENLRKLIRTLRKREQRAGLN
jgi:hypothetical protein